MDSSFELPVDLRTRLDPIYEMYASLGWDLLFGRPTSQSSPTALRVLVIAKTPYGQPLRKRFDEDQNLPSNVEQILLREQIALQKDRIRKLIEELAPGHTVEFDNSRLPRYIYFRVSGKIQSSAVF